MTAINVLLAVPPALRASLLPAGPVPADLHLATTGTDPVRILLDAGASRADIVVVQLDVLPGDDRAAPGIVSHLLAEHPHVKVLALTGDAANASLYELHPRMIPLGQVPPGGLAAVLRTALSTGV
ncbi:MAG TPA: hypothetical protein VGJ44_00520 [Kribbellaceae bacterium]